MASTNLSPRQLELLKAVVEVTKTEVDWSAIATRASFKTSKYARDSWTGVKNKLSVSDNGKLDLSARQYDLVKAYIEMMQGTTDWSAVATKAKFKTAKYARDSWTAVKNKLAVCGDTAAVTGDDGAASSAGVDDTATSGGKTKKTTSRKRKTAAEEDDDPAEEDASTKKKKAKRTARKVKKAASPVPSEESAAAEAQEDADGHNSEGVKDGEGDEDGADASQDVADEAEIKVQSEEDEFF